MIRNAKVDKQYILRAFVDPLTERFAIRIKDGKGATILFEEQNLVIHKTGTPPQGSLEEFEVDLKPKYQFNPSKDYRIEMALADATGNTKSPYVAADTTEIKPAQEPTDWKEIGMWVGMIGGMILCACLTAFLLYMLPKGTEGMSANDMENLINQKVEERVAKQASSTVSSPVIPTVVTNFMFVPTGATSVTNGPGQVVINFGSIAGPLFFGGPTSQTKAEKVKSARSVGWPYDRSPDEVADVPPGCEDAEADVGPGKDVVFRFPEGGWGVIPRHRASDMEAAFNTGTPENPVWVLIGDARGGHACEYRVHNRGEKMTVTFKKQKM